MQFDRQPKRLCRAEHARGLFLRKRNAFHEGIDRIGKPGLRHRRQHLAADQIDVSVLVAVSFGRQSMRAQKRRPDADRTAAAKRARSRQLSHLGFRVEPIAGFDLQRGHALTDQCIQPRQRAGNQFSLAGCACRSDRRDDAAARARDLFVACALQPQLEFVRAVSTEDQMGVTIHQSGHDPSPRAVDPFRRICVRWKIGTAACKDDASIARRDHAVLDDPETGQIFAKRGEPGVVPDAIKALGHGISLNGRSLTGCSICLYI